MSRTSITVAAGRISTPDESGVGGRWGGRCRHAAEGTGSERRRPHERGHPLTNLTRSMSQPVPEPAPAPAPRHIPRRYVALGLIIVAICLLGTLVLVRDNSVPKSSSTVETFNPAPSSLIASMEAVPASVYDAVGVASPANPVTPPAPVGGAERTAVAGDGRRRAAQAGRVLLRRRVRALRGGRTLAPDPRPVSLRHVQPARGHAVELDDRVRQPVDVHLLERLVHQPLGGPPVGGALQLAEPDGSAVSRAREARRPAVGGGRRLRGQHHDLLALGRGEPLRRSAAPRSRPASWLDSHRTRSRRTSRRLRAR